MQVKKLLSFFIWLGELYYLVTDKTRYFNNCPIDSMGEEEIREFLLYQLDSGKSSSTVNIYNSALCFIFGAVLGKKSNYQRIPRRRHYRGLPAIMSKDEIVRFFSAIDNLRDKAIFETVYGAGMRLSEIARLRTQDIDSEQMRIFVYHGKGGKDRYTMLSQQNLEILRKYWKQYRPHHPKGYLFYSRGKQKNAMTTRTIQNAFHKYFPHSRWGPADVSCYGVIQSYAQPCFYGTPTLFMGLGVFSRLNSDNSLLIMRT